MRFLFIIKFFFFAYLGYAQNTYTKKIISGAANYDIKLQGIDFVSIENSTNNEFEVLVNDKNGLVTKNNVFCSDDNCYAEIQAKQKIDHPLTNKINQFTQQPPTNVSVQLKIPKQKRAMLSSKIIDISSNSFEGDLKIFIEKGKIDLQKSKGHSLIEFSSGSFYGQFNTHTLDIVTRKGDIIINNSKVKSVYKKQGDGLNKLTVRSTNGVVNLRSTTQ